MLNLERITKREFILGLAIIVFCVTLETMLHPPVIETTLYVNITPIYNIRTTTDAEGNVEVYVR